MCGAVGAHGALGPWGLGSLAVPGVGRREGRATLQWSSWGHGPLRSPVPRSQRQGIAVSRLRIVGGKWHIPATHIPRRNDAVRAASCPCWQSFLSSPRLSGMDGARRGNFSLRSTRVCCGPGLSAATETERCRHGSTLRRFELWMWCYPPQDGSITLCNGGNSAARGVCEAFDLTGFVLAFFHLCQARFDDSISSRPGPDTALLA